MNTNIIEKALKAMLATADITDAERNGCINALQEIACVEDVTKDATLFDSEAVLIPVTAWYDILNEMTYDILGKRMRQYGGVVSFDCYVGDVRNDLLGFDSVPARYLRDSYELCKDLWLDNEAQGANIYNGTFNCYKNRLMDKVIAADFSCAELGAMSGALEFAINNPDCSPAWCLGISDDDAGEDQTCILDVLKDCIAKLAVVNLDTMQEDQHVFTVESGDECTVYMQRKDK